MAPDVSVVIPTRDRWEWLPRALASALGQEGVRVEVIVVDDGSVTAAPQNLLADDRVRIIRHDASRGPSAARNTGLAEATAPLVAFLDDDDVWAPGRCALLRERLDASGGGFAFGGTFYLEERRRPISVVLPLATDDVAKTLLAINCVPGGGSAILARTDLVRACGGWDEELRFAEDWDTWLRLAQHAPGIPVAEIVMARVLHAGGSLPGRSREFEQNMERFRRKHENLRAAHGVLIDEAAVSGWRASTLWWTGQRTAPLACYLDDLRRGRLRRCPPARLWRAAAALVKPRRLAIARGRRRCGPLPGWVSALERA